MMSSIVLGLQDPGRILPSKLQIQKMEEKSKHDNFKRLGKVLEAICKTNIPFVKTEEEKERCARLINMSYEGIAKGKINPGLLLEATAKFKELDAFPLEKEEVTFGKFCMNKHLLKTYSPQLALPPNISPSALNALIYYISNGTFYPDEILSLDDLFELCRIGKVYNVYNLIHHCLKELKPLFFIENAIKYSEFLNEFPLSQKDLLNYVRLVLKQKKIKTKRSENSIGLLLRNIDILNQRDSFAKLLKPFVKAISLETQEDLNHLAELYILPKKVKEAINTLIIKKSIILHDFNEFVKHFPNKKSIVISLDPEKNHTPLLNTIKVKNFLLIIPEKKEKPQLLQDYKSNFIKQDLLKTVINTVNEFISPTSPNPEFIIPKKFYESLANDHIESFTVNKECNIKLDYCKMNEDLLLKFWKRKVQGKCTIEYLTDNTVTLKPGK